MPLIINLRELERASLFLRGALNAAELDLAGVDECIQLVQPVDYDFEAQLAGKAVLVQGRLQFTVECTCVRCLKLFKNVVELNDWACHLPREGEEQICAAGDDVDLTPYLREDILLAFPQHPLCEAGCRGLPYLSASSLHGDTSASPGEDKSSAWSELNKLKF